MNTKHRTLSPEEVNTLVKDLYASVLHETRIQDPVAQDKLAHFEAKVKLIQDKIEADIQSAFKEE